MQGAIGLWSHLLAAALYGALAILQLRHWRGDSLNRPLISAFAVVSVWAIFLALLEPHNRLIPFAESARNLAFLAFMYGIMREAGDPQSQRPVKAVYASVAGVIGLQIVLGGVLPEYRGVPLAFEALATTAEAIGLTIAAGSLILVHNLYGQASPDSRAALKYPTIALAGMWAYDLHLYTVAWVSRGPADDLYAMRGLVLALLAPLFALGLRNGPAWKVRISRAATFQTLSVLAIFAYLVAMMSASRAIEIAGGDWARIGQLSLIFGMTLAGLVLLASARARAWFRVFVAKHVFEHRYDYREEWLRFTDTVGREGSDDAPLEQRVVKALCDIGGSPGGMLLRVDDRYRLAKASDWNSAMEVPSSAAGAYELLRFVETRFHVIDFGQLKNGRLVAGGADIPVPHWLAALDRAWAGIPLSHSGRLIGLVVLEHPPFRRPLDWEDYDLFRTAGIQAASTIAEARGQQALADARRFDEFNRRFAFILHDVKNLVSQLSLVARNAERHAGNPDFQADMIATLQGSVKKLNDLLARLSSGATRDFEPPRPIEIGPLIERIAAARRRSHPIEVDLADSLVALADPRGLERAVAHLVQNAVEASPGGEPVVLRALERAGEIVVEVVDRGCGMTDEFVRTRLFQPFASTKESGFGIGAYEARALVHAMGGRLEVISQAGRGTRFTLILPRADIAALPEPERRRA